MRRRGGDRMLFRPHSPLALASRTDALVLPSCYYRETPSRSFPPCTRKTAMKRVESSRRDFLKTSAAAAAAGTLVPYFSWTQKAFANQDKNDRPNIGCIGVGSMGSGDASQHSNFGDILAVCDVDAAHRERAKNDKNI